MAWRRSPHFFKWLGFTNVNPSSAKTSHSALFTVHEISPFYLEGRTPNKDKMPDGILSDIPIGALQYGGRIVTLIVAAGADPSYGFHAAHWTYLAHYTIYGMQIPPT